MRKFPRAGATAAGALITAVAASAFAAAPAAPAAPARATARAAALAWTPPARTPLAKVQPGGPIAASGQRSSLTFTNSISNIVSNNWGGYVAGRKGVRFRYIRATFFVPYLDCSSAPNSFSGHWVGIDGLGNSTVEQDGILAACQGGNPQYSAWYEMFPLPPVYSTMTVHPGDSIETSVYYDAHSRKFRLSLTDTSTSGHFSTTQPCPVGPPCQRATVEAISEAPSNGTSILPLSNFRAESFSGVKATSQTGRRGGLRSPHWDTLSITTENPQGTILDQPTSIARGKAFDCYWMAPQ